MKIEVGESMENEVCESGLDTGKVADVGEVDDDGRPKRTASAHIITAVIGSGVLSLAWCVAQLGWVVGVATLLIFACITLYTSNLLAECYRSPGTGKRNYTYMNVVKANLGGRMNIACGLAQQANLNGLVVGYTITAAISMVAIRRSNCFHEKGHQASCQFSSKPYMIGIGALEIILSQMRNIEELWWLSVIATITSFGYSSIGAGLALATIVSGHGKRTTVTGIEVGPGLTAAQKMWRMFTAFGDIAIAYTYTPVLIEVQDTIKSSEPENKVMKKANILSVSATTVFYMMCACFGYAAFGNYAHGNMLTGFGFYEPFWLIDLANIFIVLHLVGAYQVMAQPVFGTVESCIKRRWPESKFVNKEYPVKIGHKSLNFSINFLRLTWRSMYVVVATLVAIALPYFNDVLALLGAVSYWPLTVYFPVTMYIARKKINRGTIKWFALQLLTLVSLLLAMVAACGSIEGFGEAFRIFKPSLVEE
eukprot:XP_010648286.1 PREDICTED: amino acid permease 8 isoform X2 [Vitis vinifera]